MATWQLYKCNKCGYEVRTEPQGFYALMSGQYYNFKCKKCKEIVSLSSKDIGEMGYFPKCPKCGEDDKSERYNYPCRLIRHYAIRINV